MTLARPLRMSIAMIAVFALVVSVAPAAGKLTISRAKHRATFFAARTCSHDKSCTRSGVMNCRRQGRNVVLCRIFDRRRTDSQGTFVCSRLIRLSLKPRSNRVPVTGIGPWQC